MKAEIELPGEEVRPQPPGTRLHSFILPVEVRKLLGRFCHSECQQAAPVPVRSIHNLELRFQLGAGSGAPSFSTKSALSLVFWYMLYLQCQAQGVYSTTVLFRDLEPRYPHSVAALLLFNAFPRTRKVRSFTVEQSVHDVAVNLLGDFAAFDSKTAASAKGLWGWLGGFGGGSAVYDRCIRMSAKLGVRPAAPKSKR